MAVRFKLTVEIDGASLGEIDDGLMKAATERLISRIPNGQAMVGQSPSFVGTQSPKIEGMTNAEAPQNHSLEIAKPSGAVLSTDKAAMNTIHAQQSILKPTDETANSPSKRGRPKKDHAAELGISAPSETPVVEAIKQDPVAQVEAAVTAAPPKTDKAVEALSKVSDKFGIDKARECLSVFQVKRVRELPPEVLPKFIAHCEQVVL